jgi:glycosyltransferase involved in cell wall biosynthesis
MARGRVVIFGWATKQQIHAPRWATGLAGRGFKIKLISLGGEPLEGVETCALPRSGKLSYLTQIRAAAREARRFKPDLVHAHYATGFGLWAYYANLQPSIVSVWGSDIIDFPRTRARRYFIGRILNRATHITATSQLLKRKALEILPEAGSKITVIPFGVEMPASLPPLPPDEPLRICFVKNLYPKYGPEILLRALAEVRKEVPSVKLSVAGTGDLEEPLRRMTSDLGLDDLVEFVGFVPHEKIYQFIGAHHLMVMPSMAESESFGVAVLEAGACGRAVLASRIGGVPEVVLNGETGRLLNPGDVGALASAIIGLARDRRTLQRMGRAGFDFVRAHYTWDKSLDMMAALYERLIHEKG